MKMGASNRKRIVLLLLCVGFSYLLAEAIRSSAHGAIRAIDFGEVYYGARCAIEHKDPYDPRTMLREFEANGGMFQRTNPGEAIRDRTVVTVCVYPPTALLTAAPVAMLPWPIAREFWLGATACLMVLASWLIWGLRKEAPVISGCMTCFVLLNCLVLFSGGNPAGIAIPLCVVAVSCFLKDRYAAASVITLGVSLIMKPHDVGFVWLYFLLAGGVGRKRALQTLGVTAILGICAAIWISPASPHWATELHQNLALVSRQGNTSDPGPTGPSYRTFFQAVDLQDAVSLFSNDPHVYNPTSYVIGGGLIFIWIIAVLRKRSTPEGALLAMAAISALSLLPVYHRPYDAKLLLLAIPACALLWASKGVKRWIALGLTSAAILFTSDGPLMLWTAVTGGLAVSGSTLSGKMGLMLLQPAPLVLLATGCFYLWIYIRYQPSSANEAIRDSMVLAGRRAAQANFSGWGAGR